jgi:hypothetical protein
MRELNELLVMLQNWWQGQGQDAAGQVGLSVSNAIGHLDTTSLLALAGVLGWASGFRLYMIVFIMGAIGALNWIQLPAGLQTLSHPAVMSISGALLFVEFFADKIPGLDSIWDMINSVIRIPAGAALAASVFSADSATMSMVAALLGGTLAASSQAAKTTTRAAINTSPEPFSNVGMSFLEDGLVVGAVWLATNQPLVFAVCLLIALVLMWLLTWILWRFLRSTLQRIRSLYQSFTVPN